MHMKKSKAGEALGLLNQITPNVCESLLSSFRSSDSVRMSLAHMSSLLISTNSLLFKHQRFQSHLTDGVRGRVQPIGIPPSEKRNVYIKSKRFCPEPTDQSRFLESNMQRRF